MRKITALLLVLGALAYASAARIPDELLISSETASGGLRSSALGLLGLMRDVDRYKEEDRAYATIRFFVPPGEYKKFEDTWLNLEKDVVDKERCNEFFDLKKTRTDNLIYFAYGEWETHKDLRDHLMSKHFETFADEVDELGVRWEMQLLKSLSTEYEEKHGMRGKKGERLGKSRDLHHVLITYIVPPGEGKGFTDAWMDCAEETVDEKHNRNYALRKVATDNSRFYHYGTWDSMGDWMNHFESKHFGSLLKYTDKQDIVWFIQPLMKIGKERE